MSKGEDNRLKLRALLTETLPYEVPLIFSNDRLFTCLLNPNWSSEEQKFIQSLLPKNGYFTRPYSYRIVKDRGGKTTLSIAHPIVQLRMADFYYNYWQSIIQYTQKSQFSLRHPQTVTPTYSPHELAGEKTFKMGIPHADPEEGEVDVSHIVSFFTYKYNLLSKFFDSGEYISLEKKFSRMRTIDVAKCFFNIYTHSVTWAVKGKEFAKNFKDHHSFEGAFDQLMQRANFNETNGIIVGPEISRIFAEIIFQEIDKQVLERLSQTEVMIYDIRRYVDDYFIFANSDEDLDRIEEVLSEELEKFKLFINTDKKKTVSRPFVSKLTLARRNIREAISRLIHLIPDPSDQISVRDMRRQAREIRRYIGDLRLVVAEYEIGFHEISGWVLASLRNALSRAATVSKSSDINQDTLDALTEIGAAILKLAFYVASLDVRVRTTYNLCQLMIILERFAEGHAGSNKEYLQRLSFEELHELLHSFSAKQNIKTLNDSVELMNIFIIIATYLKPFMKESKAVYEFLHNTANSDNVSYFGYITTKYCLLQLDEKSDLIEKLDTLAELKIRESGKEILQDCESYLLMIDFLNSNTIDRRRKKQVILHCLGLKKLSNAVLDAVLPKLSFADWSTAAIEHLLQRKQLRSIYTWS